jgi:hypothetical protein
LNGREFDSDDDVENKKSKLETEQSPFGIDEITDIESGLFYLNITVDSYQFHVQSIVPQRGTFNFTAKAVVELRLPGGGVYQGTGQSVVSAARWNPERWLQVQKMAVIDAQIHAIENFQEFSYTASILVEDQEFSIESDELSEFDFDSVDTMDTNGCDFELERESLCTVNESITVI